ncbi:MAG: hypothetical protein NC930_07315 [Candidatus Omnitrophica bacterium]|nr:hypothetical protein [Candidatus Omnitrophota bacterium]
MLNIIRGLVLIVFIVVFCLAVGVRFHADAFMEFLNGESGKRYCKVDLKTGASLVGELLYHSEDSVKIKFEGGSLAFSGHEIIRVTEISPEEFRSEAYRDFVLAPVSKPIFTYRPEDSLLKAILPSEIHVSVPLPRAAASATTEVHTNQTAQPMTPGNMQAALQASQQAEQQRKKAEAMVREMDVS